MDVSVSQILRDDHNKRMSFVTIGAARSRTFNAQWPLILSIGLNWQDFTDNGDVSK